MDKYMWLSRHALVPHTPTHTHLKYMCLPKFLKCHSQYMKTFNIITFFLLPLVEHS